MLIWKWCAVACSVLLLSACSPEQKQTISVSGSSTIAPLMADIGKRFEALNPDIHVDVQSGGTSRGIQDVRSGLAVIGMASRALTDTEKDLQAYPIADDGIALIVHASNPLTQITSEQVVDIYTGKVSDWSALDGPSGSVVKVHKAEGRSTLELFLQHFHLDNGDVRPDLVIGDNQQGIKSVAGNPLAIGYVSIGSAEYEAGQGVPIKLLALDGQTASSQAVRDGHYPLSRTLNLVVRGEPDASTRALLDFAQSSEVADLVQQHAFVPTR
ncbi:TPA: phosphate ABC transporter substrate-binding protein [Pseudomonas aeruginosa]|uniref:phosphate ABC transporter substrate-binding protein n=1 Tax=Pseudomonas sp. TaxID=306 RepID=UPI0005F2FA3F|nr:ABC transporter substrate-binding protein [Pseudomonas oleovorans]PKM33780.1 MAG: ABC transporter substrate-binding protein [Gammaproteobacteria bacterium HGW-Gammaproteobacteria-12]HCF4209929.1 phosphate ABC transporter substrate-binding protein [Pseudomonas aeruginosa]